MSSVTPQSRPPTPSCAERARTITARGGAAAIIAAAGHGRIGPRFHHVFPDGTALLLLADRHPLLTSVWAADQHHLPAMLELADTAPIPLREPVRGLLWISGWLRPLSAPHARRLAMKAAEDRPDHRLLDIGHGCVGLTLRPASVVLADAEGTEALAPVDLARACPDPFCRMEDDWLRHLEQAHPDVVHVLTRHVPRNLRIPGNRTRPLGVDRLGLRLRVETQEGDHDIRLAFSRPATDPQTLSTELRRLVGCPFLNRPRPGRG